MKLVKSENYDCLLCKSLILINNKMQIQLTSNKYWPCTDVTTVSLFLASNVVSIRL